MSGSNVNIEDVKIGDEILVRYVVNNHFDIRDTDGDNCYRVFSVDAPSCVNSRPGSINISERDVVGHISNDVKGKIQDAILSYAKNATGPAGRSLCGLLLVVSPQVEQLIKSETFSGEFCAVPISVNPGLRDYKWSLVVTVSEGV